RFDGELEPKIVQRLQEAMKAGTKVVVERGGELDLPGVVKLDDLTLTEFYLRNYFPTWLDDELNKIFEKTQTATDVLRTKLPELGIEPAGRGPFKVGPNWRHSGDINYLIMANFDDPDYGHTVKQIMAKPMKMPLLVSASRGKAAYDLLAQKPLAIGPPSEMPAKPPSVGPPVGGGPEVAVELDMTRVQGAFVAFLPEPAGKLQITVETTQDNSRLRLAGDLIGASGNRINGVFPARIRLLGDKGQVLEEFFRVLGEDLRFEMNLPAAQTAPAYGIEVRENISGQTAKAAVNGPAYTGAAVVFTDESVPFVPYPNEVKKFMANTKQATLIVSESIPGLADVAKQLVDSLKARGITATIRNEMDAYRFPSGDKELRDQYEDGFHSWRAAEVIQPATAVDSPAIIMAGKSGSYLLEGLVTNGFITEVPTGGPGIRTRTSIQVAPEGLHWKYDTLCLIANDVSGMRQVVDTLLKGVLDPKPAPQPVYAAKTQQPSAGPTDAAPAVSFLGNNEYVTDMKFDKAGNSYIITWGHGNNIYSLDPAGKLRFTRQLPEACASRLDVFDDRVLVFTSAGSRLYQMTLDGQPIMQARLTMDPGPIGDEEYALSYVDYAWIPSKRAVLENVGTMRLFDENGATLQQWAGEQYADKDVADKIMERQPRGFVFSPDGSKVAQLETSFYFTQWDYMDVIVYDTHLVMRDLNGTLLAEYKNIANENGYGSNAPTARVYWLPGMPGPAVVVKGEKWQFDENLKLLFTHVYDPGVFKFDGEKRLVRDGDSLRYLDGEKPEIARMGPFPIMPSVASLSPDAQKIALLDEYGLLGVYEAQTGKRLIELTVSQLGHVLRFTPDSASLMLGGLRGLVACFDMQGKPVWQTPLGQFNTTLEHPAMYDPSFRDVTNMLWPEGHDQPGELEAMVKLGPDRLVNGNCETDGGWTGEKLAYQPEGRSSARSLKVGDSTVVQDVEKYLGNHVTWVLEFFYKAAPGSTGPKLTVGVMVESKYPDSFARTFTGTADWQFARIAAKSGMQCKAMRIGFRVAGGEVLVDSASFRQIRFPSINHLQYEALHEIEPVILINPLFSESYDPIGNLRMEGPGQVTVPPYGAGGKPLVEPAFLQNGRLNEITSYWYEMPPKAPWESTSFPISLALREPRWISMIALYFNCYDEANVTPHFDLYLTDLESRKEVLVASVRNNRQIYRLVKFPPIKTSLVRLELVNSIRRLRTITEVELYGPLSGKEVATGFAEPDGQNTWMGSFARVDKRQKTLAPEYDAPIVKPLENELSWSAPSAQILVSEGKLYVSRLLGHNDMHELAEPTVVKSRARTGGIGFAPYVTIYGGLLLKCGNDGKLYCIDAESGRELWSVKLAERLRCCPVAIAEDVFVANQQGKFYKLDLANGSMMMEVDLPGGVYGSLATDGRQVLAITDDGLVQSIDPATGNVLWKMPIAPYSESTPAVDANVVYLADQQGKAFALNASNGTPVWTAALGQEFTRCPVVTDKYVIFGCRDGKLAVLNRADGKEVRSIQTSSRFSYEPVAFGEQILYFDNDKAMLLNIPDGATKPLQAYYPKARARGNDPQEFELKDVALDDDPLTPISYYKGYLFFVPRHLNSTHVIQEMNTVWNPAGGKFFVLPPR
ncbi:MAG TPA: PQQ-binding-like beta-propeller repeat protein, partial [Planctomycetota bacterium]|nr:PQQ-binding-like beta-propeller repeat protein [Planctomycetota bacterium]